MIALPAELPDIINFRRGRKSFQGLGFPRRKESRILVLGTGLLYAEAEFEAGNLGSAISGEMSIARPLGANLSCP